jgi:hypothetical protein
MRRCIIPLKAYNASCLRGESCGSVTLEGTVTRQLVLTSTYTYSQCIAGFAAKEAA